MLRAELARSTDVAVGVSDAENLKDVIRRIQDSIYEDYDWPHLRQVFPKVTLNAGQRYYDPPAGLSYDHIEKAVVWFNNGPIPFERGIDFEHYLIFDSDAGVRANPAMRWEIRSVNNAEQIECWPIPADSNQKMQFIGKRALRPLLADGDVADIDDILIVLTAAAELLSHSESGDSQIKLAAANKRYERLRGRSVGPRPNIRLGMGSESSWPPRGVQVRIGGR